MDLIVLAGFQPVVIITFLEAFAIPSLASGSLFKLAPESFWYDPAGPRVFLLSGIISYFVFNLTIFSFLTPGISHFSKKSLDFF